MKSLLTVATACALVCIVLSQGPPPTQMSDGRLADPAARKKTAWVSEAWTGDNTPYHAAKVSLVAYMKEYSFSPALVDSARARFLKQPSDPMLLFKWAYIAYRTGFPGKYSSPSNALFVRDWFFVVSSPHTAEYSRLRFLIDAREFRGAFLPPNKLQSLGRRLLAHDPEDDVVKEKMAVLLVEGATLEQIDDGIGMAKAFLARTNPDNNFRDVAGVGYMQRFFKTKDKDDARMCVSYWKAYEAHASTPEQRVSEDRRIAHISKKAGL